MKKILIITDFIEGKPVIASVRYSQLMRYMKNNFEICVLNDIKNGEYKSTYSNENFKFSTIKNRFTQNLGGSHQKLNILNKVLRNNIFLFLWRNYSYSKYKFYKKNDKFLCDLGTYVIKQQFDCIFITVPDIYGLYIVEYLKDISSIDIPVIVEIRDIINNKIGKGNPTIVNSNAEKILKKYANGIIALSEGIYDYYINICKNSKIELIKNGYDENEFKNCIYKKSFLNKNKLVFAHIGSIYKGRNLKDFIEALIKLDRLTDRQIEFNIVGYLDNEAMNDLNKIDKILKSKIKINIIGTVSHDKAVELLKLCDIAVILTHKKGSDYAIPGKTYEYIGACKPIIAVTNDNALIKLIDKKYGECANHDSDDIVKNIIKIISKEYNFDDINKYSRANQAKKIIKFIEDIAK